MTAAACTAHRSRAFHRAPRRAHAVERAVKLALVVAVLAVVSRPLAAVVALLGGLVLAGAFARRETHAPLRPSERPATPATPQARARARGPADDDAELGSLLASLADGIRDPLRAAQGLVRQMGEDPESPRNVDCARLALREIDRVERNVSRLLAEAREAARRRGAAEADA